MGTKDKADEDADLLREILSAFTKYPQQLKITVERRKQDNSVLLNITPNAADQPVIIGSRGKHIQALRTIFLYISRREHRNVVVMPNEPVHGRREELQIIKAGPNWKPTNIVAILKRILDRILIKPYEIVATTNREQTLLQIQVALSEQPIADGLQPYLHTLAHAIGSKEGHDVYVEAMAQIPI